VSKAIPSPIRILLIEDHAVVRSGLRMLIESHPRMTVVGEAATSADGLLLARREQPDIILLDLNLREERGVDAIPELLAAAHKARVIILTGVLETAAHREAMRSGARGLVLKDQAADVLVQAIEQVHAGDLWLAPTLVADMITEMARTTKAELGDPEAAKIASLTVRERAVVILIGEGLKNRQIAERLHISEATVSHHLTSIFDKLGVANRFDLVIYAFRHNLLQPPR